MSSLNRIEIIGNIGKETEMRFIPSGKAITTFSVAVNEKYGEKETTEWFNIVTWDKLAENCNQYLTVGQQVFVEGRLQTRSWDDKDGLKHYKTEIVAHRVLFLGKPNQQKQADAIEETSASEAVEIPF